MTGFQPHPGSGVNIQDQEAPHLDPGKLGEALGVSTRIVNPYLLEETKAALSAAVNEEGLSLVVSSAPCYLLNTRKNRSALFASRPVKMVLENCNGCKICITDLGCPSLFYVESEKKVHINEKTCVQCGLCADICKRGALTL
jgi:indolepyruvate ferredoxin oxidoreductase alpha subunit